MQACVRAGYSFSNLQELIQLHRKPVAVSAAAGLSMHAYVHYQSTDFHDQEWPAGAQELLTLQLQPLNNASSFSVKQMPRWLIGTSKTALGSFCLYPTKHVCVIVSVSWAQYCSAASMSNQVQINHIVQCRQKTYLSQLGESC